tara:strand:- start:1807 stop:4134 length:2328 start_codon:yes stop_codon:yes gene_type:complete
MSFINANYQAKLSPTITENWIVQIFKNTASSVLTTSSTESDFLRFSFAETTYNSLPYYPAILNKPNVNYSLDLKSFTTRTGNITLNLANIDIDGTTLLEQLGTSFLNGHVNVLSQIDNDNTANNALQIFSGKISHFAYRNNMIVLSVISNRPFQNVDIPQNKTTGDVAQKIQPLVYGDYTANTPSGFSSGSDVFPVKFLKSVGKQLHYIVPNTENMTGGDQANRLEFYDKQANRFVPLTDSTTTEVVVDNVHTLSVASELKRVYNLLPDSIESVAGASGQVFKSPNVTQTGNVAGMFSGVETDNCTFSHTAGGAITAVLRVPEQTGKISILKVYVKGTMTLSFDDTPDNAGGLFCNINTSVSSDKASTSGDIELIGENNSQTGDGPSQVNDTDGTLVNGAVITSLLDNNTMPDKLYLTFDFRDSGNEQGGQIDNFNLVIKNIYLEVENKNDTTNEPIASTTLSSEQDNLYLANDCITGTFTGHSGTNDNLNNPVSIHRELIKKFLSFDLSDDSDNVNSGYKSVADLRDSSSSHHWNTRLKVYEQDSLEKILNELQYEGCFFFEYNPQAQQTGITGTSSLRYFTIPNSPNANVDLSQNDISNYELSITPTQDLETNVVVNFKRHPVENRYLETTSYEASTSDNQNISHSVVFDNTSRQKQEINLEHLIDKVAKVSGSRNNSWLNFRKSLFGEYKTNVSATLINPEKYGLLQVGDFLDFGEILFSELGEPFSSISDTFDSFVAMPTRLFNEAWSGKKFIITNLKRTVGKVSVQCREV